VLAAALSPVPELPMLPLFVVAVSVRFIAGNTAGLALGHSRDAAGAGSAVLGGLTFLVGASSHLSVAWPALTPPYRWSA
jgi:MFS transporter, DHA1 family, multidrug resistance protein